MIGMARFTGSNGGLSLSLAFPSLLEALLQILYILVLDVRLIAVSMLRCRICKSLQGQSQYSSFHLVPRTKADGNCTHL